MTGPSTARLYDVIGATWPAFAQRRLGPWMIRDGRGGGKRASAATLEDGQAGPGDLPAAEDAMRRQGCASLFMIRAGQDALDRMLAGAGYDVVDPVNIYAAPLAALDLAAPERLAAFHIWEPLAVQRDIWAAGGIGPARIDVMMRAPAPKTALLGRDGDHPAAAGFVAIHDGCAMVHALEVLAAHRRRGMGRALMAEAALWARANGAAHIAAVCTTANAAANALYPTMGMARVGQYHYRQLAGA